MLASHFLLILRHSSKAKKIVPKKFYVVQDLCDRFHNFNCIFPYVSIVKFTKCIKLTNHCHELELSNPNILTTFIFLT